jgi:hypothetical protein
MCAVVGQQLTWLAYAGAAAAPLSTICTIPPLFGAGPPVHSLLRSALDRRIFKKSICRYFGYWYQQALHHSVFPTPAMTTGATISVMCSHSPPYLSRIVLKLSKKYHTFRNFLKSGLSTAGAAPPSELRAGPHAQYLCLVVCSSNGAAIACTWTLCAAGWPGTSYWRACTRSWASTPESTGKPPMHAFAHMRLYAALHARARAEMLPFHVLCPAASSVLACAGVRACMHACMLKPHRLSSMPLPINW